MLRRVDLGGQRMLGPTYDDIRLNTDSLQLFYARLRRFCFHFTGSFQIWNQGNVDQNGVPSSHVLQNLDVEYLYEAPLAMEKENLAQVVCESLHLPCPVPDLSQRHILLPFSHWFINICEDL